MERLIERLNRARTQTQHAHHQLIGCDADPEILAAAAAVPLAIIDLKAEVRRYFGDPPT